VWFTPGSSGGRAIACEDGAWGPALPGAPDGPGSGWTPPSYRARYSVPLAARRPAWLGPRPYIARQAQNLKRRTPAGTVPRGAERNQPGSGLLPRQRAEGPPHAVRRLSGFEIKRARFPRGPDLKATHGPWNELGGRGQLPGSAIVGGIGGGWAGARPRLGGGLAGAGQLRGRLSDITVRQRSAGPREEFPLRSGASGASRGAGTTRDEGGLGRTTFGRKNAWPRARTPRVFRRRRPPPFRGANAFATGAWRNRPLPARESGKRKVRPVAPRRPRTGRPAAGNLGRARNGRETAVVGP